jgi:hypothetical protein
VDVGLEAEQRELDAREVDLDAGLERDGLLGAEVGVLALVAGAGLLAAGQVVEVGRAEALVDVDEPATPSVSLSAAPPLPTAAPQRRSMAADLALEVAGGAGADDAPRPPARSSRRSWSFRWPSVHRPEVR